MVEVGAQASSQFAEWVGPNLAAMALLAARLAPDADRDDVVQEALTSAWRKAGQFDPARGTARTWLLAIVADHARRARRRRWRIADVQPAEGVHVDRNAMSIWSEQSGHCRSVSVWRSRCSTSLIFR